MDVSAVMANPEFPLEEIKTIIDIVKNKAYFSRLPELIKCVNVVTKFVTDVFMKESLITSGEQVKDEDVAAVVDGIVNALK